MAMLREPEYQISRSPAARTRRRVRHFTCDAADIAQIEDWLQMSIPVAALRSGLETALARSVPQALRAAHALRASPRSARTKQLFREAFGVAPETIPRWRTARATWRDLGELVAIRLARAAEILNGMSIQYFCRGSQAHCSECTDPPTAYRACSSYRGHYLLCLGQQFWLWWRDQNYNSMASTLLHEALHIYFSRTVAHERRFNNANCYQLFVSRFNGIAPSQCVRERCIGIDCV